MSSVVRRLTTVAVVAGLTAAMVMTVTSSAQARPAAPDARTLSTFSTLGMHVPGIQDGSIGSAPAVPVRLWDSGVAWAQVERKQGKRDWDALDRAVAAARASGAPVLYVLGLTPKWAASGGTPNDYLSPGSTSMPAKMSYWRSWVKAVATRYRGKIEAYQIWNEANLTTFWTGSVSQMAALTDEAYDIINSVDPRAKVVAASTTLRYTPAFYGFYPAYLQALRGKGWPVDVFSGHFYPASTGTPATRVGFIDRFRRALQAAGAPNRPIWDTEINYGLAGPGTAFPDKDITGEKAAAFVAQTYLDSARLGIERAYWYSWLPEIELLGITMQPGTTGATALTQVGAWLGKARWRGCGESGTLRICRTGSGATRSVIVYSGKGTKSWKTDPGMTKACDALGACRTVTPGSSVRVGILPVRFTP